MTLPPGKTDLGLIVDKLVKLDHRISDLESADSAIFEIKTTTGDPANRGSFHFVINTFDNNLKCYADGAFRILASW